MKTVVAESSLGKIFRLTGVRVGDPVGLAASAGDSKQVKPVSSRPTPQQVAGGQLQLSSVYRSAWGNVSVGDVLEFGAELWKVIPASSYPNHDKPSAGSSGQTVKAAAGPVGGSTASAPSSGTGGAGGSTASAPSSGTGGAGGSTAGAQDDSAQAPAPPAPTHTIYLQDVKNPASYDELTLPVNFVVSIVPVVSA
jgi:hypothetical protein